MAEGAAHHDHRNAVIGPGVAGPIQVFAPARVDLSPGFTDVEPFCTDQPGLVVNVALDLGVEVTVLDQVDSAAADSFVGELRDAVANRLGLARPVIRLAVPALPTGSGLGTSGALSVALAYALSLRAGSSTDPEQLVELACGAERDVGLTGGTQDQLASVYGGLGLVRRHGDVGRRIPIDADLAALGGRLVLVHGSGSRNSGSIIEKVLHERPRAGVLRTIAAMNRVGELLAQSLDAGDDDALTDLMNEATRLLHELHPDIVESAVAPWLRELGATAAKPCGAGGPGAVWAALVDPGLRPAFMAGVTAAAGWSVLTAGPSATGTRRTPAG